MMAGTEDETNLVLWQVDSRLLHTLFGHRLDQQPRAPNEELIIDSEPSLVFRENNEMRPVPLP